MKTYEFYLPLFIPQEFALSVTLTGALVISEAFFNMWIG